MKKKDNNNNDLKLTTINNKVETTYKMVQIGGRKIPYHRVIATYILGRRLGDDEVVHHINGNKRDNRASNLKVMDRGDHSKMHNTKENKVRYKSMQMSLDNSPIIKKRKTGLTENYFNILEIFYLNSDIGITQKILSSSDLNMHKNTITNFIIKAFDRGWICELKIIEGARIQNAFMDIKQPDFLSTGQKVKDKRYKYYKITDDGKRLYEANNLSQNIL